MSYTTKSFSKAFRRRYRTKFRRTADMVLAVQRGTFNIRKPALLPRTNPITVKPSWLLHYTGLVKHTIRREHRPLLLQIHFIKRDLRRALIAKRGK